MPNNFLKLEKNFPNIKDDVFFQNQKIELKYKKNKLEITGSGNVLIQEELDFIKYKVTNSKGQLFFDANLKISKNVEVLKLAAEIKDAQSPEVLQMTSWLNQANAALEMGHSMGMGGMLSDSEIKTLESATGKNFDMKEMLKNL